MEENNYFLRITGSVNIPVPLDVDTDYGFAGNISIYKEEKGSNQDGTYNFTYKAKFTDEIQLIKGEQSIPAKNKTSQSQQLNKQCRDEGVDYEKFMTFIRRPEKFREIVEEMEQV